MSPFAPGTRVRILSGSEFPEGVTGTISGHAACRVGTGQPQARWTDGRRTISTRHGPRVYYMVEFDTPLDDGSGDGPYTSGEIEESQLTPPEQV